MGRLLCEDNNPAMVGWQFNDVEVVAGLDVQDADGRVLFGCAVVGMIGVGILLAVAVGS